MTRDLLAKTITLLVLCIAAAAGRTSHALDDMCDEVCPTVLIDAQVSADDATAVEVTWEAWGDQVYVYRDGPDGTVSLYECDDGVGACASEETIVHEDLAPGLYTYTIDYYYARMTCEEECGDLVGVSVRIFDEFLRGDVDSNGDVEPLADALTLLKWGFTDGDEPLCMDAADMDDNGEVQPLVDAMLLLSYGFQDGPEPPSPGPEECGLDLTADGVGCVTSGEACQ